LIKTCGLYKTKAKDLVEISKKIVTDFGGTVPDTIEELTTLSGVGRKTANLVCGDIYKKPAVVTDTHFIRICNRLGFVNTTNPLAVEKEMRKLLPPEKSNDFCHRTVLFGRDVCTARTAHCENCVLSDICPKKIKK
jgi:endonuclease-3